MQTHSLIISLTQALLSLNFNVSSIHLKQNYSQMLIQIFTSSSVNCGSHFGNNRPQHIPPPSGNSPGLLWDNHLKKLVAHPFNFVWQQHHLWWFHFVQKSQTTCFESRVIRQVLPVVVGGDNYREEKYNPYFTFFLALKHCSSPNIFKFSTWLNLPFWK